MRRTGDPFGWFYFKISALFLLGYPAAAAKSLQSCRTPCDPTDSLPPGSPVPGILQARTLEWGAIAFSWGILGITIYLGEGFSKVPTRSTIDGWLIHGSKSTSLGLIFHPGVKLPKSVWHTHIHWCMRGRVRKYFQFLEYSAYNFHFRLDVAGRGELIKKNGDATSVSSLAVSLKS